MTIKELLDSIFKDPATKYELTEFESISVNYEAALKLVEKPGTGRQTGKKVYYLKTLAPFHSEKEEVQIYVEDGKANPEEIVRQLWVYKLINYYGYDKSEIALEKPITFGTDTGTKFADIIVYTNNTKTTPKIVLEIKKPKRKDGIDQLRSYLNAEGSPIGVWSNGTERVILYRPYPKDFDDTLTEIPRKDQTPKDVLTARRTLAHLTKEFNFKSIVYEMEELALANFGDGVFDEIFKLIFAKIYDEIEALKRTNQEVHFNKSQDPEITYENINKLFKKACEKWPGIFKDTEKIELKPSQLSICIGQMVRVRLMGSNLRILDDAFEYLIPSALKKKDGQFFTPRHVIDMCVRMLNPKYDEYIIDPACGSAGFLLHAMEWVYPVSNEQEAELRKFKYASQYLWGIDFSEKASRTSRALMLIAGDGHTKIFGPRISTLDPTEWLEVRTGQKLIEALRDFKLLATKIKEDQKIETNEDAWKYLSDLKFDIVLSNPPFAGEVRGKGVLEKYQLAKPALKRAKDKQAKEERDVLFIERIVKMLKPGGRAAIVLPQGKFNNSSLAFIREWILRKARLLAVVGLHGNSFKPHTGTKTSVLFIQKYTDQELENIENVQNEVKDACPDYAAQIQDILNTHKYESEVPEEQIPENILELILEEFAEPEPEETESDGEGDEPESEGDEDSSDTETSLVDLLEEADEKIFEMRSQLSKAKVKLDGLNDELEALKLQKEAELQISKEQHDNQISELNERKKAISLSGLSAVEKEKQKALKDELTAVIKELREEKTAFQKDIRDQYKEKEKQLKDERIKPLQKELKAEIKQLEKDIPQAEYNKKLLTTKGKLSLILADDYLLQKLSDRFIDAEVAKRLDYPIFMAVSEQGGKNNSGEYEYLIDEDGNIVEDDNGNPVFRQDLVNYEITKAELEAMDANTSTDEEGQTLPMAADPPIEYKVKGKHLAIAEEFVKYAKHQGFNFWRD